MKKRLIKRHWPLMGILLLIGAIPFFLLGSERGFFSKSGLELLSDTFLEEGVKLENISYTQDNPEKNLRWTLEAKEVTFSQDKQFMTFKDFHLTLRSPNRPALSLQGKRGQYDRNSGLITLSQDLRGSTEDGYEFFTDLVVYDNKDGIVRTDKPIRILGPSFSVIGRGLTLSLEKRTLEINQSVTTVTNEALGM